MAGFNLEGAVVGPEVDGIGDTCNASLIDLVAGTNQQAYSLRPDVRDYQFGRLSSGNRELKVCVFLPISEQKRKFGEKAIINIACCNNGLRT